jgi:Spy/CpxP family protein refolding chaperone
MIHRLKLWLIIALSCVAVSVVSAQPGGKKNKKQEVEEKLKEYRHYVMQTELGLDDATAAKLFAATDPMLDQMRDLRAEMKKLTDDIELEARKTKPDDKKLTELLDSLSKKELEYQTLRVSAFDKTKEILTPLQRVKLLQTMQELDKKIRDLIREAKATKNSPAKP